MAVIAPKRPCDQGKFRIDLTFIGNSEKRPLDCRIPSRGGLRPPVAPARERGRILLLLEKMIRAPVGENGQMTVELVVALPVLVVVALISVNACAFFADCSVFDRVAHEAVRVHAVSPAYRQTNATSCALVEQQIRDALGAENVEVSVECGTAELDLQRFTATADYAPTLFGRGLRSEVFGVALPHLRHSTSIVVDVYKPGVVI